MKNRYFYMASTGAALFIIVTASIMIARGDHRAGTGFLMAGVFSIWIPVLFKLLDKTRAIAQKALDGWTETEAVMSKLLLALKDPAEIANAMRAGAIPWTLDELKMHLAASAPANN